MDGIADADDGTRTLLRYQHPAWGEYAAATEADYGQGRALYVGFLPQKGLISQLFDVLTADLTLNSRTSAYRYPLVVKKMRNRAGNNIHFLFITPARRWMLSARPWVPRC